MGLLTSPQFSRLRHKYAAGGKVGKVMHEFKHGQLHSGSKKGPMVRDKKQAIAIALSEKRKALGRKYAVGGPVSDPGTSWWALLQREISALGPQAKPQGSPANAQSQQQPQPMARGGKV